MDQVTKVRKYIKREQWKTLIKECQSSGMTVTAWCNLNGICEQTYYRNLKKLREELCENLPVPVQAPEWRRKGEKSWMDISHMRVNRLDILLLITKNQLGGLMAKRNLVDI